MKGVDESEESCRATADEFGGDPSVRAMRRVFSALEAAQKKFLMELGVPPFDHRLRRWRERALALFEASWARSARGGLHLSETEAGELYVHCLGKIMTREGVEVPPEMLPRSEKLQKPLREVFP
jgi:predicted trehalose synthase